MKIRMALPEALFTKEVIEAAQKGEEDVQAVFAEVQGQADHYTVLLDGLSEDDDVTDACVEFWGKNPSDPHMYKVNLETKKITKGCVEGGYCNEHREEVK